MGDGAFDIYLPRYLPLNLWLETSYIAFIPSSLSNIIVLCSSVFEFYFGSVYLYLANCSVMWADLPLNVFLKWWSSSHFSLFSLFIDSGKRIL